jgi:hypothetical protein
VVAIGTRIRSGTTRSSSPYSSTSKAVSGPAAFSQTTPRVVGARSTVTHGRRCGWVTSPTRRVPSAAQVHPVVFGVGREHTTWVPLADWS